MTLDELKQCELPVKITTAQGSVLTVTEFNSIAALISFRGEDAFILIEDLHLYRLLPETITLYRHTIKHTEPMPEDFGYPIVTYYQSRWDSIKNIIPGPYREVIKTETKDIEIN